MSDDATADPPARPLAGSLSGEPAKGTAAQPEPGKAESSSAPAKAEPTDDLVTTKHTIRVGRRSLAYTAVTGRVVLREEEISEGVCRGHPGRAQFFITSYTLDGADPARRPVIFAFNGGPGSSSVWLVPLLALARPRWRMALLWQLSEIAVWVATLLWLLAGSDPNKAMTYEGLTWFLLIRDGFLLAIVAMIVAEMFRPELDVVRSDEQPDPGAGLFADSPVDRRLRDPRDLVEYEPAAES